MKKIILAISVFLLFTGCADMMNTPTKRVEEFLGKYQTMDSEVLKQLDDIIEDEGVMTDKQKEDYRDLMKKQYQNLSYKIKDETVNGDTATVDVEIEVFDYSSSMKDAQSYLEEHKDEFLKDLTEALDGDKGNYEADDGIVGQDDDTDKETTKDSDTDKKTTDDDSIDNEKFMDYKISKLKDVKDKVKYTLTFTLTKKDKKWVLDDISEIDRLKIHGLYEY